MDNNRAKIKSQSIDLKLQKELYEIDKDFERRGLGSSGDRIRVRGIAEKTAWAEKELLKLETDQSSDKNKLIFYPKDGKTIFTSVKGVKHETKFTPKTNSYRLIGLLSSKPGFIFSYSELSEVLNKARLGGEDSTQERRAQDTVKSVRNGLRLSNTDDIFIVEKGFGFNCNVEIKK